MNHHKRSEDINVIEVKKLIESISKDILDNANNKKIDYMSYVKNIKRFAEILVCSNSVSKGNRVQKISANKIRQALNEVRICKRDEDPAKRYIVEASKKFHYIYGKEDNIYVKYFLELLIGLESQFDNDDFDSDKNRNIVDSIYSYCESFIAYAKYYGVGE